MNYKKDQGLTTASSQPGIATVVFETLVALALLSLVVMA